MNLLPFLNLHHQARYLIMKVLRHDAAGGMTSVDDRAGGAIPGFGGTAIHAPKGDFWFARDGVTPFMNGKGKLPRGGSYREYTVNDMTIRYASGPARGNVVPGSARIVHRVGTRQFFFTPDHYGTFYRITGIPSNEDAQTKYGPGF